MTISIPAQAFAKRPPQDLLPGQLFKMRGHWAMRVVFQDPQEHQGFVMLEGERAGQLMRIPDGIAPVVGIVEPFSWFPGVDETATPQAEGLVTAALSVGPSGVFITGGIIDGWGDGEHFGFSLDGRQTEDVRGNTPRFARWTIELCDVARPFHSLGILATIDRTERVV